MNETKMGNNRTGIDTADGRSTTMVEASESLITNNEHDGANAVRGSYFGMGEVVGTVAKPATGKGMLTTIKDKLMGHNPEVLIDKLGERLAFERSGVRLYELMMLKCAARTDHEVPASGLQHIRDEESDHFAMLTEAIESLGADSTSMSPCADVTGVASMGIVKVLSDPRTTVAQCLEALLQIELIDNASWELLIKLVANFGLDDTAALFSTALTQEEEHLRMVKGWLEQAVMSEAS